MSSNSNLHKAKIERNDEFFTLYEDIEKEMVHYKQHFNGKTVYCNCDDARESNFFKYFAKNFERLGLKKLITTGYKADGNGVALIYEGDKNDNYNPDSEEITIKQLNGNGDFRSAECVEFLKEADIVVTNPPFSLFREYIAQLMEYGKKFIVIGSQNAITYKDFFPLIKENKIWLGMNIVKEFRQPDGEIKKFGNIGWFTNLNNERRNRPLDLFRKYSNECYPHYDNYDAIHINKVCEIPTDYDGIMGVPISFLNKYCPDQFELIALCASHGKTPKNIPNESCYLNGKWLFPHILIKRK